MKWGASGMWTTGGINLGQLEIYMVGDNQDLWFLIWSTSHRGGGDSSHSGAAVICPL